MTTPIRDLHRAEAIRAWMAATDAAIFALVCWRATLQWWRDDDDPPNPGTVALAFTCLDRAGLGEWAEWGAGQDLDALVEAVGRPLV